MPICHQSHEYYICSDGPESHGDLFTTVLPRLRAVCSRAHSMTWGNISFSLTHRNLPFGIALEHMRTGNPARVVTPPDKEGNCDASHWIILQLFKSKKGDWDYQFKTLEKLTPDEPVDLEKHYLINKDWHKPTNSIELSNDWIVSFGWETTFRENNNQE